VALYIEQGSTVSALILDASDVAVVAGTTTVVVTDDGGTTLETIAATHSGAGRWTCTPTSLTFAALGRRRFRFTNGSTIADEYVEAVGVIPVKRSMIRREAAYADPAKFPGWLVDIRITEALDRAQDLTGYPFVKRRRTERVTDGRITEFARWGDPDSYGAFVSATLDGAATSTTGWTVGPTGEIDTLVTLTGTLVVTYDYGASPNADELEALVTLTQFRLARKLNALPAQTERAYTNAAGHTVYLARPGARLTGIDEVDAVLTASAHRVMFG
jgi:hypothetical protein